MRASSAAPPTCRPLSLLPATVVTTTHASLACTFRVEDVGRSFRTTYILASQAALSSGASSAAAVLPRRMCAAAAHHAAVLFYAPTSSASSTVVDLAAQVSSPRLTQQEASGQVSEAAALLVPCLLGWLAGR